MNSSPRSRISGKIVETPSAKLTKHDSLVVVLDTVAILCGICERLPLNSLPDGSRPDVLRLDRQRKILFIGDAKNRETSGNRATQLRLRTYLRWIAAFLWRGRCGVFSLCFEHAALATGWVDTMLMLTNELSMRPPDLDISVLPPNLTLVRFIWTTPSLTIDQSRAGSIVNHLENNATDWQSVLHSR
jgi:hypothetical protein